MTNIVCALTCYNYRADTIENEEDDLILLLDVLHHTNKVVTIAESVEMTETEAVEVQHERIPRRRKRLFERFFFPTINRKVKEANKYHYQLQVHKNPMKYLRKTHESFFRAMNIAFPNYHGLIKFVNFS